MYYFQIRTRVFCRWALLNEKESKQVLRERRIDAKAFREELLEHKLCSTETVNGVPRSCCKVQCSHHGKKIKIGLVNLWASLTTATTQPGYKIEDFVVEAFKLDKAKENKKMVELVLDLYDQMAHLPLFQKDEEAEEGEEGLQEQDQPTMLDDETDDEETAIKSKNHRKLHPVAKLFKEDLLTGVGLSREKVLEQYTDNEDEVQLDQVLTVMQGKVGGAKSSYNQYIRTINLFLLWCHTKWPQKWHDCGMIRVNPDLTLLFMEALRTGGIQLRGDECAFSQLLDGSQTFTIKPRDDDFLFTSTNATFKLSAISCLHELQTSLLNESGYKRLRAHPTIKTWEDNLAKDDVKNKKKRNFDREKVAICVDDPMAMKQRQSTHWLLCDNFQSTRNRFLSLAQCFSISRTNDVLFWRFKDITPFTYPSSLPCVGPVDIDCIYMMQSEGKSINAGACADVKLIVRHSSLLHCPMSAFGMFLYSRFVQQSEPFPPIVGSCTKWLKRPVFRTNNSMEKGVSSETVYDQRRDMISTSTLLSGCINHQDRHLGTLIGRLFNVSLDSIRGLGHWQSSTMEMFYAKYSDVDTVSRMAGFASGLTYLVERAIPDFEVFRTQRGGASLFGTFMGEIYDPQVEAAALEYVQKGYNSHVNFLRSMRMLARCFWTDLPHYYRLYPQLSIFKSAPIVDNWSKFMEWVDYVESEIASYKEQLHQDGPSNINIHQSNELCSIRKEVAKAKDLASLNQSKLDRLLHLVESGQVPKRQKLNKAEAPLREDGTRILQTMRPLNDMSLIDLWSEWTLEVVSEGTTWPALSTLEKQRLENPRCCYRAKSLKTSIERRSRICRFIEDTSQEAGTVEKAIELTQNLMSTIGEGKSCSLYQLSEYIRKL